MVYDAFVANFIRITTAHIRRRKFSLNFIIFIEENIIFCSDLLMFIEETQPIDRLPDRCICK